MVLYLVPVGRQSIHGSMYRVRTLCVYDDVLYYRMLCTGTDDAPQPGSRIHSLFF